MSRRRWRAGPEAAGRVVTMVGRDGNTAHAAGLHVAAALARRP